MRHPNIYIVTKMLPAYLGEEEIPVSVRTFQIEKVLASSYVIKTETGTITYLPFKKIDECPITADFENLLISATVQAYTEKEALQTAEEKMSDYISKWMQKLNQLKNESHKEDPDRW